MFRFSRKQQPDEEEKIDRIVAHIEDKKPLFNTGSLAITPKIIKELQLENVLFLLRLHDHGYWGIVPQVVSLSNSHIAAGNRQGHIVSRYEWDANEVMVVSERVGTKHPLTKMYFVRDDADLSANPSRSDEGRKTL
ncbi:MAG: hypothetical protein H6669_07230 [Ardenticatenaceae bacterium]|nr:hypothetical protein [Ardenticatenaceae bacterium]